MEKFLIFMNRGERRGFRRGGKVRFGFSWGFGSVGRGLVFGREYGGEKRFCFDRGGI